MTDLTLAVAHHLLIFGLAGILATEAALVFRRLDETDIRRLAGIDAFYGITAGLILLVGAARVIWGVKGPDFYLPNPVFWAKIGCFAVVGLLSIMPSIRFVVWRRQVLAGQGLPGADDLVRVRRLVAAEIGVFVFIPVFAAAMARGYGL